MNHFDICEQATFSAADMAVLLIQRIGKDFIESVRLNTTDNSQNSSNWPLIYKFNIEREGWDGLVGEFEVRVSGGHDAHKPKELIRCLRAAGFGPEYISDQDVMTKKFDNVMITKNP